MTAVEYVFGIMLGALLVIPALCSIFGRGDVYEEDPVDGRNWKGGE